MSEETSEGVPQGLTPLKNAAIIHALLVGEADERRAARRVVWLQMLVISLAAVVLYVLGEAPRTTLAVVSGGLVSVLNGALLAWRMSRMASVTTHDAQVQLRLMYFYAAERFLVVMVLLAFCLAALKLEPLPILGGFVIGQAVLLMARLFLKIKTEIATKNG